MTDTASSSGTDTNEVGIPLDFLLGSASVGTARRLLPNSSTVALVRNLALRPRTLGKRIGGLAGETAAIVAGRSDRAPERSDRRFTDPAWEHNPVLHRLMQTYLAVVDTGQELIDDAELNWRDRERAGFLIENILDAIAPSNNPLTSPDAWKAIIDTGGASAVRGLANFVDDMSSAPRVPSMVSRDAFEVGKDLAITEGAVVFRDEIMEVIQYAPQTKMVRRVPLILIPPVINKFYIADLAPGRSLLEYYVQQGQQCFVISWRNPDERHREWGFDEYCRAILNAMGVAQSITGSDQVIPMGTCSGGQLLSMALAHLAEQGTLHDRVAGMAMGVTVLDSDVPGLLSALDDEGAAAAAVASSGARGYLEGSALAEMFAWLRPNDLVWNYWVNNYLKGRKPPAFDILYWNADTTRMTAGLHRDFIAMGTGNVFVHPGELKVLGSPVDLGKVDVDSYIMAGIADHISSWKACYRSTQLLGGQNDFVLSTSGHIASIVNPPGKPKAQFRVNEKNPEDADAWFKSASVVQGSWWPHFDDWLKERSGTTKRAPKELGNTEFEPLERAPGTYVFEH